MHTSMRLRSHTARKHIPSLCDDVWQIILNHLFFFCGTSFCYLRERCRLRAISKDFFMDKFCYMPTVLNLNMGRPEPPGSFDGLCRILPRISFQNIRHLLLDRCVLTYQDQIALSHGSWNSITAVSLVNCGLHDWPCSRLVKRLCEQSLNSLKKLDLDQNCKLDQFTFYEIGYLYMARFFKIFGTYELDRSVRLYISLRLGLLGGQHGASLIMIMNGVMNELEYELNNLHLHLRNGDYINWQWTEICLYCDAGLRHWKSMRAYFMTNLEFECTRFVIRPPSQRCLKKLYELPVPQLKVKLVSRGDEQVGRRSLRLM